MDIAADVGGTKVVLGAFAPESPSCGTAIATYRSADFDSFALLFESYLREHQLQATQLRIGIAGPVFSNKCSATNLPWVVDGDQLRDQFSLQSVTMANDLVTAAFGLATLQATDIKTLNKGAPRPGNRALIAAGTGLGQGILYWDGKRHHPFGTEGGHTNFGPNTDEEIELLKFLLKRHKRVSWERVVSGRMGFANIYRFASSFAADTATIPIDPKTDDADYGPKVTTAAKSGCPLALSCIRLFLKLYGAEAGNLALKSMSVNGLYIAGGIIHHLESWVFDKDWFWQGFTNKGRFSALLEEMPVHIVKDPYLALHGAMALAT